MIAVMLFYIAKLPVFLEHSRTLIEGVPYL